MTTARLLNHFHTPTLILLAAELLANNGNSSTNSPAFRTEDAAAAYGELITVGIDNAGEDEFFALIDDALAAEAR